MEVKLPSLKTPCFKPGIKHWYDFFCTNKPKDKILTKEIEKEMKLITLYYPFLEESQIMGKVLQKFGIPHIMGQPNKKQLRNLMMKERSQKLNIVYHRKGKSVEPKDKLSYYQGSSSKWNDSDECDTSQFDFDESDTPVPILDGYYEKKSNFAVQKVPARKRFYQRELIPEENNWEESIVPKKTKDLRKSPEKSRIGETRDSQQRSKPGATEAIPVEATCSKRSVEKTSCQKISKGKTLQRKNKGGVTKRFKSILGGCRKMTLSSKREVVVVNKRVRFEGVPSSIDENSNVASQKSAAAPSQTSDKFDGRWHGSDSDSCDDDNGRDTGVFSDQSDDEIEVISETIDWQLKRSDNLKDSSFSNESNDEAFDRIRRNEIPSKDKLEIMTTKGSTGKTNIDNASDRILLTEIPAKKKVDSSITNNLSGKSNLDNIIEDSFLSEKSNPKATKPALFEFDLNMNRIDSDCNDAYRSDSYACDSSMNEISTISNKMSFPVSEFNEQSSPKSVNSECDNIIRRSRAFDSSMNEINTASNRTRSPDSELEQLSPKSVNNESDEEIIRSSHTCDSSINGINSTSNRTRSPDCEINGQSSPKSVNSESDEIIRRSLSCDSSMNEINTCSNRTRPPDSEHEQSSSKSIDNESDEDLIRRSLSCDSNMNEINSFSNRNCSPYSELNEKLSLTSVNNQSDKEIISRSSAFDSSMNRINTDSNRSHSSDSEIEQLSPKSVNSESDEEVIRRSHAFDPNMNRINSNSNKTRTPVSERDEQLSPKSVNSESNEEIIRRSRAFDSRMNGINTTSNRTRSPDSELEQSSSKSVNSESDEEIIRSSQPDFGKTSTALAYASKQSKHERVKNQNLISGNERNHHFTSESPNGKDGDDDSVTDNFKCQINNSSFEEVDVALFDSQHNPLDQAANDSLIIEHLTQMEEVLNNSVKKCGDLFLKIHRPNYESESEDGIVFESLFNFNVDAESSDWDPTKKLKEQSNQRKEGKQDLPKVDKLLIGEKINKIIQHFYRSTMKSVLRNKEFQSNEGSGSNDSADTVKKDARFKPSYDDWVITGTLLIPEGSEEVQSSGFVRDASIPRVDPCGESEESESQIKVVTGGRRLRQCISSDSDDSPDIIFGTPLNEQSHANPPFCQDRSHKSASTSIQPEESSTNHVRKSSQGDLTSDNQSMLQNSYSRNVIPESLDIETYRAKKCQTFKSSLLLFNPDEENSQSAFTTKTTPSPRSLKIRSCISGKLPINNVSSYSLINDSSEAEDQEESASERQRIVPAEYDSISDIDRSNKFLKGTNKTEPNQFVNASFDLLKFKNKSAVKTYFPNKFKGSKTQKLNVENNDKYTQSTEKSDGAEYEVFTESDEEEEPSQSIQSRGLAVKNHLLKSGKKNTVASKKLLISTSYGSESSESGKQRYKNLVTSSDESLEELLRNYSENKGDIEVEHSKKCRNLVTSFEKSDESEVLFLTKSKTEMENLLQTGKHFSNIIEVKSQARQKEYVNYGASSLPKSMDPRKCENKVQFKSCSYPLNENVGHNLIGAGGDPCEKDTNQKIFHSKNKRKEFARKRMMLMNTTSSSQSSSCVRPKYNMRKRRARTAIMGDENEWTNASENPSNAEAINLASLDQSGPIPNDFGKTPRRAQPTSAVCLNSEEFSQFVEPGPLLKGKHKSTDSTASSLAEKRKKKFSVVSTEVGETCLTDSSNKLLLRRHKLLNEMDSFLTWSDNNEDEEIKD